MDVLFACLRFFIDASLSSILLDRVPGSSISKYLGAQPYVERVTVLGDDELDSTIRDVVMKGYRYAADRTSEGVDNAAFIVDERRPIVVFISTYYSYPELAGICNIIMFHDLM